MSSIFVYFTNEFNPMTIGSFLLSKIRVVFTNCSVLYLTDPDQL